MNPDGSELVNISNNPYQDDFPDWSPDGTKIVFSSIRPGVFAGENRAIWVMNADGSEQRMLIDTPVRATTLFLFFSFLAIIGRVDNVHKPL